MDWLIPAITANLISTLILILVYLFLYQQFRQKFLLVWMIGWVCYGLRFLAELARVFSVPSLILSETALLATLVSGLFQLWGTYLFVNRKLSRSWIIGGGIAILLSQSITWFQPDSIWLKLPVYLILGAIYIWSGIVLARAQELERTSRWVTGGAFIVWGIHKVDYPFLRPLAWFAPWGFLLAAALGLIVALGFILVYFQRLLQQHRQTEAAVRQGSEDLIRLFQNLPVMLVGFDENDQVAAWNLECERVTGYSGAEVIGRPKVFSLFYPDPENRQAVFDFAEQSRYSYRNQEWTLTAMDGSQRTILWSDLSRENPVPGWKFWCVGVDVTDRKQVEARYATILSTTMDGFWSLNSAGHLLEVNDAACQLVGYSREELLQMNVADLEALETPEEMKRHIQRIHEEGGDRFETRFRRKGGRVIDVEVSVNFFPYDGGVFIAFMRDISARKQAEESLHERVAELEAVSRVSAALRPNDSLEKLLPAMTDEVLSVIQAEVGGILTYDAARGCFDGSYGRGWADAVPPRLVSMQSGPLASVLRTGQPYMTPDASQDPQISAELRAFVPPGWGGIALPLQAFSETVGVFVAFSQNMEVANPWKMRLLETLTEILGSVIHQLRLRSRTERNLNRMAALHEIDATIASSLDLRMTMEILLAQTVVQLGVDAAEVLLMNSPLQRLEGLAGRGFRVYRPEHRQLRPGEGPAGRALLERRLVEFHLDEGGLGRSLPDPFYESEGICEGYALPLMSKGQIVGVLVVLGRRQLWVDADWIDFLKTLAGQAGLAIDDIGQVEKLKRSYTDLVQSYSITISSLSRLIEMRLGEREGQNQQLADLATRLAEALGVPTSQWLALRQGIYLRDIGLLAVPDAVLFKAEPLDEAEWALIRQHPQTAYDLLNASAHLRPYLDIPFCHHERWDGSGYPLGLKGDAIPLAARIAAVVEYWQAQQNFRARRAFPWAERPSQSIAQLAGTWFDPQVAKAFLEMSKR